MAVQRVAMGLVLVAGLADAAGGHSLAFYALVLAVPAIAATALSALGTAFDGDARAIGRAWVHAVALVLVLASAAARASSRGADAPPRLAISALVVCLLVFAADGAVHAWPHVRRRLGGHPRARALTRS
jgi:4-amino-4-deoxy-L-arabinose transferase-like glycosyltransferase